MFLGATSSGKSTLIGMLFRSAMMPRGAPTPAVRSLIYDSKGSQIGWAAAACRESTRLKELNPFSSSGLAWDIAKDSADPVAARQIASILIPTSEKDSGDSRFYTSGSREIVTACMILLNERAADRWTLRDLLLLALDAKEMPKRLAMAESFTARRVASLYLTHADPKVKANMLSSISASMGVYEPVAAAWSHATGRYSIAEWGQSRDVIVLGNEETSRETLDPINRAILARAAETALSRPDLTPAQQSQLSNLTWFFLDEVREAGKIDGLRRLLNQGRSKGVCTVLGIQDIEGMRAEYRREEAHEMAGQCAHKVALRLSSPDTALWVARLFGEEDQTVETTGESVGNSFTGNRSRKTERKTIVTTAELLRMPNTSPEHGLTGYYKSPVIDNSDALRDYPYRERIAPWRYAPPESYSWSNAVAPHLMREDPVIVLRRPPSAFILEEWSPDEIEALFGTPNDEESSSTDPFFEIEKFD